MPDVSGPDAEERFEQEFQRHWLTVFRFALAWTNDWSAAEDLAQDAFARLWANRTTMDWSTSTLAWLLTTTRHLATDRFRRLRRAFALTDGGGTPALDSDARLRWLDVRSAMAALTPVQRSALVLTTVVGLDSESAARMLDTSPWAVRAAVSRARARLVDS